MTALPTLSGGFEEASTADKGHDRAARVRDSMSLNDVTHEEWTVDQALVDASKASGAT